MISAVFRQNGKLWKSVNMNGRWRMLTSACLHQCITRLTCTRISCLNIVANDKCVVISQFIQLNYSGGVCRIMTGPRVGPGHGSSPPPSVHLLPHLFPSTFLFLSLALLIFFFCHPFPFYQNSPTLFPGRRS